MQGYVAARSALIWVQTPGAAEVALEYAPENQPGEKKRSASVRTDAAGQFCAHLVMDDLSPGTRYRAVAWVNGKPAANRTLVVRTQPIWQFRSPPPDVTLLTGSCAYLNDPLFDRPGQPYGGGYEIYEPMTQEGADLMVWLGDNLYYREVDCQSPQGMALRYRQQRGFAPLDAFLRSTPQVAIWDDHDYGPNDRMRVSSSRTPRSICSKPIGPTRRMALATSPEYSPRPASPMPIFFCSMIVGGAAQTPPAQVIAAR
jgi:Phosphodiesterase/alkaline phosphatase D